MKTILLLPFKSLFVLSGILIRLGLASVLIGLSLLGAFVSTRIDEPMGETGDLGEMSYREFMADRWEAIQEAEPKCQVGSVATFAVLVPAFSVFYTSLAVFPGWYPHSSASELRIGDEVVTDSLPVEWSEVPDLWWKIIQQESWITLGEIWTRPGPRNFPGWCTLRAVR